MTILKSKFVVLVALSLALPATAAHGSRSSAGRSHSRSSSHARTSKKNHHSRRATSSSVKRDRHGRIKRSSAAKHAFERQHPCPSTGRTSGRCPGYVVDHVKPLECGGVDAPGNMQWQTIAEGKAKDKTEGRCR
jgi:5-methylcytosine-specific restriction endonuclease McrA